MTITSQDTVTASVNRRLAGGEEGSTLPLDVALALFRREAAARGLPSARVRAAMWQRPVGGIPVPSCRTWSVGRCSGWPGIFWGARGSRRRIGRRVVAAIHCGVCSGRT